MIVFAIKSSSSQLCFSAFLCALVRKFSLFKWLNEVKTEGGVFTSLMTFIQMHSARLGHNEVLM